MLFRSLDAPAGAAKQVPPGQTLLSEDTIGIHHAPPQKTIAQRPSPQETAARSIPPRSHNSLLHDLPSTTHPASHDQGLSGGKLLHAASSGRKPALRRERPGRFAVFADANTGGGAPVAKAPGGGGERDRTDDLLLAKRSEERRVGKECRL